MNQCYINYIGWNYLGFHPSILVKTIKSMKCDGFTSYCCSSNPHDGSKAMKRKNFSEELSVFFFVSSVSCICTNFLFYLPTFEAFLIDKL